LQRQTNAQKRLAKEKEQEEIRQLLKEEKLEELTTDDLVHFLDLLFLQTSLVSTQSSN
jgi:hypothetical protein